MLSKIKERCIYCGGDIYYHLGEKLIKCEWCGHSLVTSKFENELARIQEIEEENALIKDKLAQAEKEKQAANDRLFAALSSLGEIQNDQDVLGKMLNTLTGGQQDALQSLQFLKGISERLVNSQNDIFARMGVMNDIAVQLQKIDIEEQERQSVMNEFMLWSQQSREEDLQRLQMIASSTDELLEGQKEISSKVDTLREKANELQKSIDAFHAEYTKDKLEELRQLYHQAANFQHDREFDKAEKYYHRVLTKGGDDAEVYWRLLMCHYCLFYQKDDEGHLIPIILNPDLTDPAEMSLRRELDRHMAEQERPYYQSELDKVDRILDKYRLLKDQVQYDVFISVKQNQDGHYTSDSDIASDLHDFLEDQGLQVFNSRRTAIPAGQEYEPYIISALMSAKVLIVVGTTPENMNSPWVRNEWSRFQWLQYHEKEQTGRTERVLFCYLAKGMQAEQIPKALNPNRQAIRDGVRAHDELIAGLAFLKPTKTVTTPPPADFTSIENLLKFWLIQGRFDDVKRKCQELADTGAFLTHASLHLAALCAENKASDIMQVVESETVLDNTKEFKAAFILCKDDKEMLRDLLAKNIEWRNNLAKDSDKDTEKQENLDEYNEIQDTASVDEWFRLAEESAEKENYTEALKWYQKAAEAGHAESQYALGLSYLEGWDVPVDEKRGVDWIRKAAEAGYTDAMYELGGCYHYGKGIRKNQTQADKWYKKAVQEYKKAADAGDTKGQTSLALCYKYGDGVPKDLTESAKWYRKAAEQGDAFAQRIYADCLVSGEGVSKNTKEALTWYQKAADQGDANAKEKLEELQKTITTKDSESADDCLKKGIEAEEKADYTEALKCYRKAANQGLAEAQYHLGLCYENGNGIRKNKTTAKTWYQKAADQGFKEAKTKLKEIEGASKNTQNNIDNLWAWHGPRLEDKGNYIEAMRMYYRVAEKGNEKARIQLEELKKKQPSVASQFEKELADDFFKKGTDAEQEKNFTEALNWYQKAADNGLEKAKTKLNKLKGSTKAKKDVSPDELYLSGKKAEEKKDYTNALKWYKKAAEANHIEAQYNLAKLYLSGNVPEEEYDNEEIALLREHAQYPMPDLYRFNTNLDLQTLMEKENAKKAIIWCRKAAEAGHVEAQYLLGAAYSSWQHPSLPRWYTVIGGREIKADNKEARKWFEKAAQAGNKDAQFMLGQCYEKGQLGVAKSKEKAKELYRKASSQGHQEAKKMLNRWFW